jgi:hypothetical protein
MRRETDSYRRIIRNFDINVHLDFSFETRFSNRPYLLLHEIHSFPKLLDA